MHAVHRIVARNTAGETENKIHEDSTARALGFAGGLVPGVTTWAYLVRVPAAAFGLDWVERGTMSARFRRPVYEGDEIEMGGGGLGGSGLELTATNAAGEVVATGTAGLPPRAAAAPELADYPPVSLPTERPEASRESLAPGTALGTLELGFHSDRAQDYLSEIDDDLDLWRAAKVAHPGWLLRFANSALSRNVALGPWMHTESSVHHMGLVRDGDRVSIRSRVSDQYERNGNEFVTLDVLYAVGERPVLHAEHTAIWKLRGHG